MYARECQWDVTQYNANNECKRPEEKPKSWHDTLNRKSSHSQRNWCEKLINIKILSHALTHSSNGATRCRSIPLRRWRQWRIIVVNLLSAHHTHSLEMQKIKKANKIEMKMSTSRSIFIRLRTQLPLFLSSACTSQLAKLHTEWRRRSLTTFVFNLFQLIKLLWITRALTWEFCYNKWFNYRICGCLLI